MDTERELTDWIAQIKTEIAEQQQWLELLSQPRSNTTSPENDSERVEQIIANTQQRVGIELHILTLNSRLATAERALAKYHQTQIENRVAENQAQLQFLVDGINEALATAARGLVHLKQLDQQGISDYNLLNDTNMKTRINIDIVRANTLLIKVRLTK